MGRTIHRLRSSILLDSIKIIAIETLMKQNTTPFFSIRPWISDCKDVKNLCPLRVLGMNISEATTILIVMIMRSMRRKYANGMSTVI